MSTLEIDCQHENRYREKTDKKRHFCNWYNESYKESEKLWDDLTLLHESSLNGGGTNARHKFIRGIRILKKQGVDTLYFDDFINKEANIFPLLREV